MDLYLGAAADADGIATIEVRVRASERWIIRQVSPSMPTAVGATIGMLRKNGFDVAPFVPASDAIGGEPPVELAPGDVMSVVWEQAPVGATAQAWVSYEQLPL